jgi:hypothetical protein
MAPCLEEGALQPHTLCVWLCVLTRANQVTRTISIRSYEHFLHLFGMIQSNEVGGCFGSRM